MGFAIEVLVGAEQLVEGRETSNRHIGGDEGVDEVLVVAEEVGVVGGVDGVVAVEIGAVAAAAVALTEADAVIVLLVWLVRDVEVDYQ